MLDGEGGGIPLGREIRAMTHPIVAVDDGYAQTKLLGEGEGGTTVRLLARSSMRAGRHALAALSGEGGVGAYRTEEGEEFTVSEEIESESTQFDGFHTSPLNRVLVHHALREAGYGGKDVRLVVGLPVADFFLGTVPDRAKIEEKRANLMKGVDHVAGLPMARAADVRVGCQAIAAFYDHALDDGLQERADVAGSIAVVDVGGRTTDIALIKGGKAFDPARSGTANIGVLDVYAAVADGVRARFGLKDRLPVSVIDRAVRSGSIRLWGRQEDVSDLVSASVKEQETKVAREVERRLGAAAGVDVVLFVGGGSALFTSVARHFPNGATAEDPEFANARGLRKYVRYFDQAG